MQQSRQSTWQPVGEDSQKRWKQSSDVVGFINSFIEAELTWIEDQPICAIEDLKNLLMPADTRTRLRQEELTKLAGFCAFKPVLRSTAQGKRTFGYRWVDTDLKSRLTLKELKAFGDREN